MQMSEKIEKAVAHMRKLQLESGQDWVSPTEIGKAVGGQNQHSAYGSPICKAAVEKKIMIRNDRGHYKLA